MLPPVRVAEPISDGAKLTATAEPTKRCIAGAGNPTRCTMTANERSNYCAIHQCKCKLCLKYGNK